jgi:hypothetical protein
MFYLLSTLVLPKRFLPRELMIRDFDAITTNAIIAVIREISDKNVSQKDVSQISYRTGMSTCGVRYFEIKRSPNHLQNLIDSVTFVALPMQLVICNRTFLVCRY